MSTVCPERVNTYRREVADVSERMSGLTNPERLPTIYSPPVDWEGRQILRSLEVRVLLPHLPWLSGGCSFHSLLCARPQHRVRQPKMTRFQSNTVLPEDSE